MPAGEHPKRIGLVGCVKSKLPVAAPARELYTSALFRGRRRFVERTCDEWFVLSAKHGLIPPDALLEPYDVALTDAAIPMRREWAQDVLEELETTLGSMRGVEFEIHAGAAYRDFGLVEGLCRRGASVVIPTEGLNQGQQLAFYRDDGEAFSDPRTASAEGEPTALSSEDSTAVAVVQVPAVRVAAPSASRDRGSSEAASLAIEDIRQLDEFIFAWPDSTETFDRGWGFVAVLPEGRYEMRHGIGRRHVFGRERVHSVTWVNRVPIVEGAETETYPHDRTLAAMLKLPNRADARSIDQLPPGYEDLRIVVHRDVIQGPNARKGLAVIIRDDDLASWARFALLRHRDRTQAPVPVHPRPEPVPPSASTTDAQAVVRALLDHAVTISPARDGETGKPVAVFTPNADANAFLLSDPFAFLAAVICDQGIRAERAWEAPYRLRERLGHWDLDRIADEPDQVGAAFQQRPALHRMVDRVPRWISLAAGKVRADYRRDAARIWPAGSTARDVRDRLEAFAGIGQKKAAMAVEILERDLGVSITDLAGSDIAYDVHVRRVFMRTGLAERDNVGHMVVAARREHPERPGALDYPAWDIGRRWCRPTNPRCDACVLARVCPQLVHLGGDVVGM